MTKILRFITDVKFYAPIITLAKSWPTSAFVSHFNEPNPWEGPAKGEASHILDVAFLFQNFNEHLNTDQVKSAQSFGNDFIAFVNGEDPYPAHNSQRGGAKVYGPPAEPGGSFIISEDAADYGRRPVAWQLSSAFGLDKLSAGLDAFIAGH
jgi:hypothetical protein